MLSPDFLDNLSVLKQKSGSTYYASTQSEQDANDNKSRQAKETSKVFEDGSKSDMSHSAQD